jgi:hypothetical protein
MSLRDDLLRSVAHAQFPRIERTIAALEIEAPAEGSARADMLLALREKRDELLRVFGPFA